MNNANYEFSLDLNKLIDELKKYKTYRVVFYGYSLFCKLICGTTDFFIGKSIRESDLTEYMKIDGHVAYWNITSLMEIAKPYEYSITSFQMIRPGSILPDEKFGKLWPNKRVFFLHPQKANYYFSQKAISEPILPIDKP